MKSNKNHPDDSKSEAERILKRVDQESEVLGSSSFSKVADRVNNHMNAADADQDDRIEVLGTRIGRGLSVVFFIVLVIYLANTYVFK